MERMDREMECNGIEELIPLYIDGDLTGEEMRDIRSHIGTCAACSASFGKYMLIEESLAGLREDLPDTSAVYGAVASRLGLGRRRPDVSAIRRLPAASTFLLLVIAAASLAGRNLISRASIEISSRYGRFADTVLADALSSLSSFFDRLASGYNSAAARIAEAIGSWTLAISDLDPLLLLSIYSGMILLMILSFGMLIRRILQD